MKKLLFSTLVLFSGLALHAQTVIPAEVTSLLEKNGCVACHKVDKKMVGPAWIDIAAKKYSKKKLVDLVYKPVPENWPGYVPMQPMPQVPKADAGKIADWIVKMGK
ncbi:MAG: cytochrome C [Saprospiraceae bacterium]|nr:cytochrome C [Saprospiraceae bacterium]